MKKVLYVIGAIALIYLALCVMGPAEIKVERATPIHAPKEAIKSQIVDYNMWVNWSPWVEKDTAMKITIEGEAGKVGHKYTWEGNKEVGKGTMELMSVTADSVVEKLGMDGHGFSDVIFVFKPEGEVTNVTWIMNMKIGFFGRGMMLFMKGKMDKMLGEDFEKGLSKLKVWVKNSLMNVPVSNYEVKELNWDERTYYGKKASKPFCEIAAFYMEVLPKLGDDLAKNKIVMIGMPGSIFFNWDDSTKSAVCAPVMCVKNGSVVKGWEKFSIPASKVLLIEYFGAYDKSLNAHLAMDAYMKEKGLTQAWVIEEYANDPLVEKDTAKWQTNIFYVLKK